MKYKTLVTGGVGFIGSFIVDRLIEDGHSVCILDNLEPQVHQSKVPSYLNPEAEFIRGDMNDTEKLKQALEGVEVIFHDAAMVGVGQSMYQPNRYFKANTMGTSNMLQVITSGNYDIKKVIVASSMSTYGEGSYNCEDCREVYPPLRSEEQMKKGEWELYCPNCGKILKPVPTKESKNQDSNSIYAITKKDQEDMVLTMGKAYGIPSVALRYFNVFGPRQSLSNPYTGVVAIFSSRIKNNKSPIIFEDGNQSRDFLSVHDIVEANILSMNNSSADYEIFNVGAGRQITIKQIAEILAQLYNKGIKPDVINKFRKGDVRHCFADISKIKSRLGFEPKVGFDEGLQELIQWSDSVKAEDKVEQATEELKEKGLVV